MKFSRADTHPVNSPSSSPTLTRAQVWAGLKLQAHDPLGFGIINPNITACEVLHEDDDGLTRVVTRKSEGQESSRKETEVVTFSAEVKVEYATSNVTRSEIISTGQDETDLYLSFVTCLNFQDIQAVEGSEVAISRSFGAVQTDVVARTIEKIRALVKDGVISAEEEDNCWY